MPKVEGIYYVNGLLVRGEGSTPESRLGAMLEQLWSGRVGAEDLKDFITYPGNLRGLTPREAQVVIGLLIRNYNDTRGQRCVAELLRALSIPDRGRCLRLMDGQANQRRVAHLYHRAISDPRLRAEVCALIDEARPHMVTGERIVISDIDDTVIPSRHHPLPDHGPVLPGAAAFFRALDVGPGGTDVPGDVHFVTARELDCAGHTGMVLRRTGVEWGSVAYGDLLSHISNREDKHRAIEHKKKKNIAKLMERNPCSRVVFVGDSTQADPVVFHHFLCASPDRVELVLIHRVSGFQVPDPIASHPQVIVFETYAEAAQALYSRGLISRSQLEDVLADR